MERKMQLFNNLLVLDGGFSTQLIKYVGPNLDNEPLWTAGYNITRPQDVKQVHLDYMKAGADIIITNTYQASIEGFKQHLGLNREQSLDLIRSTAKLALEARELYQKENPNRKLLVMGSIGPYGAHLHDGSEYNGSYAKNISQSKLQDWHRPRIQTLLAEGVDGLAIETIPCQLEAEALIDLIVAEYPDTKAWMSFQCQNESSLANGDYFRNAALSCWNRALPTQSLIAVGVNCIHPKYVAGLFESLNNGQTPNIPLIVYPNSCEQYVPGEGWKNKDESTPLEEYVNKWISLGAKIIGGCCRTDDEYIKQTKKIMDRQRNKQ